ncbi:MAG: VWA domain-containing protein [Panacagrimonas sp.]
MKFHRPRRSLLLLIAAMLVLLPVYATPTMLTRGPSYAYLFVVDVSQSMNVRDPDAGDPRVSRLDLAKRAIIDGLRQLPCGSTVSVGLFADIESLVLFEPLEVCAHYPAMENIVSRIDARMAWAGNSQIDSGLISAMAEAARRKLNLIFITDGDQAPFREAFRRPKLQAARGSAGGLLVGVGGEQPRPVPKLDADNNIVGYWQTEDAVRNGFNPNLAPVIDGLDSRRARDVAAEIFDEHQEHLSALRTDRLEDMADAAGLDYLRLTDVQAFARAVDKPALANLDQAQRDLRIVFGLLAAFLLLAAWLPPERA